MQEEKSLKNGEDILRQLAYGDEKAFRQLYENHWNRVYTIALLYLKSPVTAQDIVQDVFLKLWLKRNELYLLDNFSAFLYTMTRNQIISELRKKTPDYRLEQMDETTLPSSNFIPSQDLEEIETEKIIQEAINQLSSRQQQVYRMSREEGLPLKEVARQLDLSYDTTREHMSKALKGIRVYLGYYYSIFILSLIIILKK